ncbi:hypothetical protein PENSPDRAFT_652570 [Peniophora sp. CONT]|nr:hypothetical protein PENSPDRAFT_652570 [Peniophora sp. CONT]
MSDGLPVFDTNLSPRYTQAPDPSWVSGQPLSDTPSGQKWRAGEEKGWQVINASTENPMKLYSLMISGIVPRPIAFVSTIGSDGSENLAPFSWFNQVSAFPPVISISCMNGPPRVKDTANNIRATKEFTVNIISEAFVANANMTSVDAPAGTSEWGVSGLTKASSLQVKPARVQESAFSMECELFDVVDIKHPANGVATTTMFLGLVKYVHVRKDVLKDDGTVDPALLQPVARMGDITYARLGDLFRVARPIWTQPEAQAENPK